MNNQIKNSPFIFVFLLYFVLILISVFRLSVTGELGGDFESFDIYVSFLESILVAAEVIFFEFIVVALAFFIIVYSPSIKIICTEGRKLIVVDLVMFFIITVQLFVMMFTNVGSAVRGAEQIRSLELLFAAFQPLYLFIIYMYSPIGRGTRLKFISQCFFIVCILLSGFMGYLLYLFPFVISLLARGWSFFKLGAMGVLLVLLLPFVRYAKFLFLGGLEVFDIRNMSINSAIELYTYFLSVVVDRFCYVSNVIYIRSNLNYFTDSVGVNMYPFFQGYLGSLVYKIFNADTVGNINQMLFYHFSNSDDSNSTFPLYSYFDLSMWLGFSSLIYSFFIFFVFFNSLRFVVEKKHAIYIGMVAFYTLILGGWFWPFANFMQAIIVFLFIVFGAKFINMCKRN